MKAPTEEIGKTQSCLGLCKIDFLKQKQRQLHTETVLTVRCDICACLPSSWDLESLQYRAHQFCGTKLAVEFFVSNHPLLIRIVMFTF